MELYNIFMDIERQHGGKRRKIKKSKKTPGKRKRKKRKNSIKKKKLYKKKKKLYKKKKNPALIRESNLFH